jgi:hypothetical protein
VNRANKLRAILRLFADRPDVHISEMHEACGLRVRDHDEVLGLIKEVQLMAPYLLVPAHERKGMWTGDASAEVRMVNLHFVTMRHASEVQKWSLLMMRHRRGDPCTGLIRAAAANAVVSKEMFDSDLPDPQREDYCLSRIDRRLREMGREADPS